ncbi:hypothetical protein [Streptomyces smyrnaeus]|uniref:hypothetical protein n=1 Tax=Streptomyces smyrnaeus TaxID=1387713 RepID=UPI0036C20907
MQAAERPIPSAAWILARATALTGLRRPLRQAHPATGAERIAALRKSGCAVLWLTFAPRNPDRLEGPLPGATHVELTNPAEAVAAISKAATAALTAAP